MRNIKVIRAEIAALRAEYEAKTNMLRAEIFDVQKARGFVPKQDNSPYYEQGRSEQLNHNGAHYG